MSILLVRIDDRLIHGQVMVGWRQYLGADCILVASDRLSCNPMGCSIFRLTAPPDVILVIDGVKRLSTRLKKGEFEDKKTILLFENLSDFLTAINTGLIFSNLNIGGLRHRESQIAFSPSVSLTISDIKDLLKIIARGIAINIQMVPRERPITLNKEVLDQCLGKRVC